MIPGETVLHRNANAFIGGQLIELFRGVVSEAVHAELANVVVDLGVLISRSHVFQPPQLGHFMISAGRRLPTQLIRFHQCILYVEHAWTSFCSWQKSCSRRVLEAVCRASSQLSRLHNVLLTSSRNHMRYLYIQCTYIYIYIMFICPHE